MMTGTILLVGTVGYLSLGLTVILFTRARTAIRESTEVEPSSPAWKRLAFRLIIYSAALVFWPLFLGSWFAKPKTAWDELQENPIFQQQKELFEAMSLMCEDGVDADEMPNGRGDFGMVPSNPIPCKTVFGSTSYLGRLRTPDGTKVVYERAGSVASGVSPHPVDAYEVSHPNGPKLATLFISPYQKRISGKAPRGFKLAEPLSANWRALGRTYLRGGN